MQDIPMKGQLNRQVNVRITEDEYKDLEFLRVHGVDVGEMLRPDISKRIRYAVKVVKSKIAG